MQELIVTDDRPQGVYSVLMEKHVGLDIFLFDSMRHWLGNSTLIVGIEYLSASVTPFNRIEYLSASVTLFKAL